MYSHKFAGNVAVISGGDLFVEGNTILDGNLTVNGLSTILDVEKTVTADSVMGLNTPISVANKDGGIVIEKHPTDIINPVNAGTIVAATLNTATLAHSSGVGWVIKILAGTGAGQSRRITNAVATLITVDNWSVIPDGTSTYELFNETNAAFIYDTSDDLFRFGVTPDNNEQNIFNIIAKPIVVSRIEQTIGENVIYVGKHGNDTYSGGTISEAKLTFAAALAAGSTIVCLDGETYVENLTASGKAIYAPNAILNGTQNFTNTTGHIGKIVAASGSALTLDNSDIKVDYIENAGGIGVTFANNESSLNFTDITAVTGLSTTVDARINGSTITASGTAIITDAGTLSGSVSIIDAGTALSADNGGLLNIISSLVDSTTLIDTNISGTAKLTAGDVTSETLIGAGTSYWIDAEKAHTHIASTANPHNTTLEQIGILTTKGDVLTHDGVTHKRLAVGTNGHVLTANTAAPNGVEWAAASGNTDSLTAFTLIYIPVTVNVTSYTTKSQIPWDDSLYSGLSNGAVIVDAIINGIAMDVQIRSDATVIGSMSIATTGQYSIGITNPSADSTIFLDVKKASEGANPEIRCATLKFGLASSTLDASTQFSYKTVSGTYNALTNDHYLLADTSGGVVQINLPTAFKKKYIVIDKSGNAATNNITVSSPSNINGAGSFVISTNNAGFEFVSNTSTWYAW